MPQAFVQLNVRLDSDAASQLEELSEQHYGGVKVRAVEAAIRALVAQHTNSKPSSVQEPDKKPVRTEKETTPISAIEAPEVGKKKGGVPKWGYSYDDEGRYVVEPIEVETQKRAMELFEQGVRQNVIADRLNEESLINRGIPWNSQALNRLLRRWKSEQKEEGESS
jgi:hypothetical protein